MRPTAFATGLVACLAAYGWVAWSVSHNAWPIPQLRVLKNRLLGHPAVDGYDFDPYGRLTSAPQKVAVPCPKQTGETRVLLVLGQSNAANHGGQRHQSKHPQRVVNWFAERCYAAQSPLLGASGQLGEQWTRVGDRLVEEGRADAVVIAPSAIGGTRVSDWAPDGYLHASLRRTVTEVGKQYRITDVIWQQGETDASRGTSATDYKRSFLDLVASLRSAGISAPFYVAIASRCGEGAHWSADNPVAQAQRALPDGREIKAGPDVDALVQAMDRYDGCHLGGRGLEIVASAWTQVLISAPVQSP